MRPYIMQFKNMKLIFLQREAIKVKLSSDNETLAENKALILYILDKVNKPIFNDALL